MSLLSLIKSDLDRYAETYRLRGQKFSAFKIFVESFLFKSGFKAVFLYRVSHAFYRKGWTYCAWWLARCNQRRTGAEIEFNASIGPGLLITHPSGIVIGRGTRIGSHATIYQGATFGVRSLRPSEIHGFPRVGDHCLIFAHAVIIGDVQIGDRAVIAANAVVHQSVPSGALAAGIPARVFAGNGDRMHQQAGNS